MQDKRVLKMNEDEQGIIINALNDMRSTLLEKGSDAEPVNDVLLKVIEAPSKRMREAHAER